MEVVAVEGRLPVAGCVWNPVLGAAHFVQIVMVVVLVIVET